MKKVIWVVLPLMLLAACDRPEQTVQLNCMYWDVDAEIYKDKIVMDITTVGVPDEENDGIPERFLVVGRKNHVTADRYISWLGGEESDLNAFSYYKSFSDHITNEDEDVLNSVGLVLMYDRSAKRAIIEGLSFSGTFRYECGVKIPYTMK